MSWIHTRPRLRTSEPRRWHLRTYLLAPVLLVALAVALSHANIELSIRAQTQNLVAQRGSTVLGGIEQQLNERERAMQVYAQLLADQRDVVLNTDAADKIGLAQVLLPQKAKLDLERIAIQLPDGLELIRVGPANEATVTEPLVAAALAGITRSRITVSIDGLTVLAATPVKGPRGIVGALVVGRTLDVDELRSSSGRDGVEFALFRGGNLVRTTTDDPDLLRVVDASVPAADQVAHLNATLHRLHFQSVAKPLGVDGVLLALVPTADLDAASQQRTLVVVGGMAALVMVLLFALLFMARNIARPLESMVAATAKMVHGDYGQRVPSSSIVELADLAGAVNYLAEQVQRQLAGSPTRHSTMRSRICRTGRSAWSDSSAQWHARSRGRWRSCSWTSTTSSSPTTVWGTKLETGCW